MQCWVIEGFGMSDLKGRFRDGTKIPTGEKFDSDQEGFCEAFNEVFGFHDTRVISSKLSFKKRNLELLVNYIAEWKEIKGVINLKWRKLLLRAEDIDFIDLGNHDPEYRILVYVTHSIGLINLRNDPSTAKKLAKRYPYKLKGAELNAIELEKYSSMGFPKVRVKFDWLTASNETWVPEKIKCSRFSLEFKSETADRGW
jgi:hypothetical protein